MNKANFKFNLPLLICGATGTNLMIQGYKLGDCMETWILDNPEKYKELLSSFIKAGSKSVSAPTFGANATRLGEFGLSDRCEEINKSLVALAREITDEEDVLLCGDISPSGLFTEPTGEATFEQVQALYHQQITALIDAGVDFIYAETLMALTDVRAICLVCKELDVPLFISITINDNNKTFFGLDIQSFAIIAQSLGAWAVGINCSNIPHAVLQAIKLAKQVATVPIISKLNAGVPGKTLTPTEYAEECKDILAAGAVIIGGCCGTTCEHIAALKAILPQTIALTQVNIETYLANERNIFLLNDYNLADEFINLELELEITDEKTLLKIKINTQADIDYVNQNIVLLNHPLAIYCDDIVLLEQALQQINAKVAVLRSANIKENEYLAAKYGAVFLGE